MRSRGAGGDLFNRCAALGLGDLEIVIGLQAQPEIWAGAEVAAEAQGGVGGDGAFARHNLRNAGFSDVQGGGEGGEGEAEGVDLVFQNLAGVDRRQPVGASGKDGGINDSR